MDAVKAKEVIVEFDDLSMISDIGHLIVHKIKEYSRSKLLFKFNSVSYEVFFESFVRLNTVSLFFY